MGFAEYTKVVLVGQRDSMPHFMLLFARIGRKKRLRVPRDSCKVSSKWHVGKRYVGTQVPIKKNIPRELLAGALSFARRGEGGGREGRGRSGTNQRGIASDEHCGGVGVEGRDGNSNSILIKREMALPWHTSRNGVLGHTMAEKAPQSAVVGISSISSPCPAARVRNMLAADFDGMAAAICLHCRPIDFLHRHLDLFQ